jgi:hypothetical protein
MTRAPPQEGPESFPSSRDRSLRLKSDSARDDVCDGFTQLFARRALPRAPAGHQPDAR